MDKLYEFTAVIKSREGIDGAYIEFPYSVKEEFGTNGMIKVIATFDGEEYRGILIKMGLECHMIGITQALRAKINKQPGDEVVVTIKRDTENKVNEMTEDLRISLEQNTQAMDFFETLTASQKNKFITFVSSAKKKETADARIEKVIAMLANKEKMK